MNKFIIDRINRAKKSPNFNRNSRLFIICVILAFLLVVLVTFLIIRGQLAGSKEAAVETTPTVSASDRTAPPSYSREPADTTAPPTETVTDTPTPSPTAAPTATPTPVPTATPTPTPTPMPTPNPDNMAVKSKDELGSEYIVGYLYIPGTNIDYPVVQYTDKKWLNNYFLERDIYGNYYKPGSIFLDYENDISKADSNTILYGHNMADWIMFHEVRFYITDKNYWSNHKYIIYDTLNEQGVWEVYSAFQVNWRTFDYVKVIFSSKDDFGKLAGEIKRKSYYNMGVEITADDRILTLSTCTNGYTDDRYVACFRLITDPERAAQIRVELGF